MPSPPMTRPPPPPPMLRAKPSATEDRVMAPAARKTMAVRAARLSEERSLIRDIGIPPPGADTLLRNSPIPPVRKFSAGRDSPARQSAKSLLARLRADEADDTLVLQLLHRARELFLRQTGHGETNGVDATAARAVHDRDLVVLEQLVHVAGGR